MSLYRLPIGCLILALCTLPGCATLAPPAAVGDGRESAGPTPEQTSALLRDAEALAGAPYREGGASPATGFDCSGLVHYVYGQHGVRLPRVTGQLATRLPAVALGGQRPGDLLFFDTRGWRHSHVGIYLGGGRFVHAPSQRTGRVIVSSLERPYWRDRLTGVRRPPLSRVTIHRSSVSSPRLRASRRQIPMVVMT